MIDSKRVILKGKALVVALQIQKELNLYSVGDALSVLADRYIRQQSMGNEVND